MLKNKFKIIAILTAIILALTLPVVRAENEISEDIVDSETNAEEISNDDEAEADLEDEEDLDDIDSESNTDSTNEDIKNGDVYLTGDTITIDYVIDGNLFVVANDVTINSQIGGDAFICANNVTIGEQGYIFSNLFTFSKNVTINGVVYDLYSASQTTTIAGYIYRDIRVGSNTLNVFGTIGRNAYVNCVNLNFSQQTDMDNEEASTIVSQGMIGGNLNYKAKQELSIPENAVSGETTFTQENTFGTNTLQKYMMSLGTLLATVIIIWLLCLWLAPKFLNNVASCVTTKKILPVIGFGILTPIVAILLAIILFILGITSTLGLLLLISLFILIVISTSIFIITINNIICNKLKIQKTLGIFGMLIVSAIVLWLISLIPYVGTLVEWVVFVIGLGIIIYNLVLKIQSETTKK